MRLTSIWAGVGLAAAGSVLATLLLASPAWGHVQRWAVSALPPAKGLSLPDKRNDDAEPGIGVAGGGAFWIGSDINPNESGDARNSGALSGEDIWRSTDGGRTYRWIASPFNSSSSSSGLGGEDSDLTVAPAPNRSGNYNVYATSLYVASSSIAISSNGGRSWSTVALGGVPAEDRPWLTAVGPCTLYLTYHQLPLFDPVVNTYNACHLNPSSVATPTSTLDPVHSTTLFLANSVPGTTNDFGKPAADTSRSASRGTIYVPMEGCAYEPSSPLDYPLGQASAPACPKDPSGHQVPGLVEVAISRDGGATFRDSVLASVPNGELPVWSPTVAVGSDGTVYLVWGDNHHAYLSVSHDHGRTWTAPGGGRSPNFVRVDSPRGTAVYPTVAAGRAGVVQVAYYGTSIVGDSNDAKVMGTAGDPKARARWHLYWASSTNDGKSFSRQRVSGVNHTGELCTFGSVCQGTYSRDLLDDFGVSISPTTGLTSIAFDSDEPLANKPAAHPTPPFTAYATELPATGRRRAHGSRPGSD
jgi:hypothetical protein